MNRHLHRWASLSRDPAIRLAKKVGQVFSDALFPFTCRACGIHRSTTGAFPPRGEEPPALGGLSDDPTDVFHRVALPFLCQDCIESFEPVVSPLCSRCGLMFKSRISEDHLCGECLRRPKTFRKARSSGVYTGGLMALIHQLKYRACLSLIRPLGRLLADTFGHHWGAESMDLVLPMPLHPRRIRQRGFNQVQLMTDSWADATRQGDSPGVHFLNARRVLVRSKPTIPQTGLDKAARRRNIRRAFKVVDSDIVRGCRILLVDDVYTTGATAEEAARELLRNGADTVDVLTIARTMPQAGL